MKAFKVSYKPPVDHRGLNANTFSIKQIQHCTTDRMGDLVAFPIKIAGTAVAAIKLPELIRKVKKTRPEMGECTCAGDFL